MTELERLEREWCERFDELVLASAGSETIQHLFLRVSLFKRETVFEKNANEVYVVIILPENRIIARMFFRKSCDNIYLFISRKKLDELLVDSKKFVEQRLKGYQKMQQDLEELQRTLGA